MVTVSLLTYNGARYLPACIGAVKSQTYRDWRLVVLDNGSSDESVAVMEKLAQGDDRITVLPATGENLGFAAGHNRIGKDAATPYLLLLNQDVVMAPDYLEKTLAFAEKNPQAAAVSGVLLRWLPDTAFQLTDSSKTRTIDSAGLRLHRSFQVTDARSGEAWDGGTEPDQEVFGVSGALPLYRTEVFQALGGFDEDFFMYKEDVDFAFRLRHAGYRAYLVPAARAYHHRGVGGDETRGNLRTGAEHRARSFMNKHLAYRNHWYVLLKDVALADWLRYGLFIAWYELRKFGWLLLFDQKVSLSAGRDIVKALPQLRRARRRVKPRSMGQWTS